MIIQSSYVDNMRFVSSSLGGTAYSKVFKNYPWQYSTSRAHRYADLKPYQICLLRQCIPMYYQVYYYRWYFSNTANVYFCLLRILLRIVKNQCLLFHSFLPYLFYLSKWLLSTWWRRWVFTTINIISSSDDSIVQHGDSSHHLIGSFHHDDVIIHANMCKLSSNPMSL